MKAGTTRKTPRHPGRSAPGRRLRIAAALPAAGLAGCNGVQSAFNAGADDAARLFDLSALLFVGAAVIFTGVMALIAFVLAAEPRRRLWASHRRLVVWGGAVFPSVTLALLLGYGLWVLRVTNAPDPDALLLEVTGEQYWFRVRYPAAGGAAEAVTANEIAVPVGRPVRVALTAADVIHSFWIPSFAGKVDMIPGRVNAAQFTADRPGRYRGVCAEFCGAQHAKMAFDVVALEPDAFEAWRARRAAPAAPPANAWLLRGAALFARNGCGTCHAVRGTEHEGRIGPDLTHVGARLTIGAGSFPNNPGTLGGWVASTQHLKAGARMPSYGSLAGEDLRALAEYLWSLQ